MSFRTPLESTLGYSASILLILVLTLTPSNDDKERNLRPFTEIGSALAHPLHRGQGVGLVGNILLFVPFGIVLLLDQRRLLVAVILGAALSAAIETTQLWIPGRTTSTDDVILNTLGTTAGYVVARTVRRRRGHR